MIDPGNLRSLPGAAASVLPDPLRRAFGFADDDDSWFARLGSNVREAPLGRIGHYELLQEIGHGGQGRVYRARQEGTGREIALKRLLAGVFAGPSSRARFEREIEAAAALDHPNIVALYGTEVVDGQPLLAMQWIDGVPFDAWARPADQPGRPLEDVLATFGRVCDAIHHAHQRGVIHRDLKPSNILVDREGQPHVLDFGLAKLEREDQMTLTQSGDILGTPAYAAPEQIGVGQGRVDVRTDVYALGVLLYQALAGRRPFEASENLAQLIQAIERGDPQPPSAIRREIPRDLDAIVQTAIALEPDRRYGSVEALAADVRRFLAGEVVLAHPPTVTYRVGKFLRRHAVVSTVGALALAAICALGVVSTLTAAREHALRVEAAEARGAAEREAIVQRDTADALLGIITRAANHMPNRRSIETRTLRHWLLEPLQQGNLKLRSDAQVKMHLSVFEMYMTTADYKEAQEQLDASLPIIEAMSTDPEDLRWAHTVSQLRLHSRRRMYPEMEVAARDLLRQAEQKHGIDSQQTALAINWIGYALRKQGFEDEGFAMVERAVAILQSHDSVGVVEVRNTTAIAHFSRGDFDRARDLVRQNIEYLEARKLMSSKYAAWSLGDLGIMEFKLGNFDEAERLLAQLAEYRIRANGLKYNRTSNDLWWHAWALHALGRLEEALVRIEQSLVFTEVESRDAPLAARKRFQMAVALFALGRDEDGRLQLLQAISKGKVLLPGDAEWDARAAQVETLIREHELRYDEHLGAKLGEYAWLMSHRTAATVSTIVGDSDPGGLTTGIPR